MWRTPVVGMLPLAAPPPPADLVPRLEFAVYCGHNDLNLVHVHSHVYYCMFVSGKPH